MIWEVFIKIMVILLFDCFFLFSVFPKAPKKIKQSACQSVRDGSSMALGSSSKCG